MRKIIVLIVVLLLSISAFAQLEVKEGSFKEVPDFVNINPDQNYQTDDNDLPFAVIKVRTENITDKQRRELKFGGNSGTFIMLEYKDGEVWVYLTAKYADYLKISHPDFSSVEFSLPYDLKPKCGYEMTLVNKSPKLDKNNYLIVKANQPNAKIYIDDELVGTGYASKVVSIGEEHTYRISCDDYYPKEGLVYFDKREDKEINVILEPNFGYIIIKTEPSGAEVYIDEQKVGVTPYQMKKIGIGEHIVEIRNSGYESYTDIVVVKGGEINKQFENIKLAAQKIVYGVLAVYSTPENADIAIDNEYKGKTPRIINDLPIGAHTVVLSMQGYVSASKTVTVFENDTVNLNMYLTNGREITISTDKVGDAIFIDGNHVGESPLTINLSYGEHEISAVRGKNNTKEIVNITQNGGVNSVELTFPIGAGNGIFSVSADKKVYFSKGNLQYQASTKTWRFAEHQWDCIGAGNNNISPKYSGWIDLFGWGTGDNPTQKRNDNAKYYQTFSDWGNNYISNGENKQWRTLSNTEWEFVMKNRVTKSGTRFAMAKVNGKKGVIILPDNWKNSMYDLNNINNENASYDSNIISLEQWTMYIEANGAIFLPVSQCRMGSVVQSNEGLGYWTSSVSARDAIVTGFDVSFIYAFYGPFIDDYPIFAGYSVRLVSDVK